MRTLQSLLLLAFSLVLTPLLSGEHSFFVTISHLYVNEENLSLDVVIEVEEQDIADYILQRYDNHDHGNQVSVESRDSLVSSELIHQLKVYAGKGYSEPDLLRIRAEQDGKIAVFLSYPLPKRWKDIHVECSLFKNVFHHQENIVHFYKKSALGYQLEKTVRLNAYTTSTRFKRP